MAKWIGGIVGAVISGVLVILIAAWLSNGDNGNSDNGTPVPPNGERTVEAGGFRTETLTDVLTGISGIIPTGTSMSLSRNGERVVFSAFSRGGLSPSAPYQRR